GRVHLADRAVGAHGEQPVPRTWPAGADGKPRRRLAKIEQRASGVCSRLPDFRVIAQSLVQAGCDMKPRFERRNDFPHGSRAHGAASVRFTEDEGLRAAPDGLLIVEVLETQSEGTTREPALAEAQFAAPCDDPAGCLDRQRVRGSAEV